MNDYTTIQASFTDNGYLIVKPSGETLEESGEVKELNRLKDEIVRMQKLYNDFSFVF